MFIDLTEEQESLRKELKSYFNDLMTPKVRAEVKSADFAEKGGPGNFAWRWL